jgi:hypothetical protein
MKKKNELSDPKDLLRADDPVSKPDQDTVTTKVGERKEEKLELPQED